MAKKRTRMLLQSGGVKGLGIRVQGGSKHVG